MAISFRAQLCRLVKGHVRALSGHDLNMSPSFPGILSVYAAFPAPPPAVLPLLHQLTSLHDIWRYFFAFHLLKMLKVNISPFETFFPVEIGNNLTPHFC